MSKQPKALEMAKRLLTANLVNAPLDSEVAAELKRLHAVNADLLEALKDLINNVNEAMRTGGWVPTPLHASFWEAMLDATAAIDRAEEEQ